MRVIVGGITGRGKRGGVEGVVVFFSPLVKKVSDRTSKNTGIVIKNITVSLGLGRAKES